MRLAGRRLSGFTLIELLVVIAVIAILASILFPVFAQAKGKANQSACSSNLKQLATACLLYADDWRGFFPYPGGNSDFPAYDQDTNGGLDAYIKNKSAGATVWRCPGGIKPPAGQAPTPGTSFASMGRSYAMNDYLRPHNRGRNRWPPTDGTREMPGINTSQLSNSSQTILFFETYQQADATAYRNGSPHFRDNNGGEPTCMHNGKMNIVLCDSHAALVFPPETWSADRPLGGPNVGMYRPRPTVKAVPARGTYARVPDMWVPFENFQNYPSQ